MKPIILSAILYLFLVLMWIGVLYLIRNFLVKLRSNLKMKCSAEQISYLKKKDIMKLVNSLKKELFLEEKIIRWIPNLPYPSLYNSNNFSDEELRNAVKREFNFKYLSFFIERLLPIRLSNIIFLILILYFYLNVNFSKLYSYLKVVDLKELKKVLPYITPSIALVVLIISWYFISRGGYFRRAKGKIRIEDFENKIRFHKKNRILLATVLFDGYKNTNLMIIKRDSLLKDIKDNKSVNLNWLNNISGLNELDKFVSEYQDKYKDPIPVYINRYHISFTELNDIYNEIFSIGKRLSKLQALFLTKDYMVNYITYWSKNDRFEDRLNELLVNSVRTFILAEQYLKRINKELNKKNFIYSVTAFITNKDK